MKTSMRILSAYRSLLVLGLLSAYPALAAETFVIEAQKVPDEKPVFATIESVNVAPARALRGVRAALTARDVAHLGDLPCGAPMPDISGRQMRLPPYPQIGRAHV